MTFTLTLSGDTPAELLGALTQLSGMTLSTPPAPQPQSAPVAQQDKPKAPGAPKAKRPTQEPTTAATPAPVEAQADIATAAAAAPQAGTASTAAPDPATLGKIRDLARTLIVSGKRAEVQTVIKSTGAASISKLPPESCSSVWEQLCRLKDEVDADAAD